jgi:hypothetical protein
LRAAATKAGDIEAMSLWAGQAAALARPMPAAALVAGLVAGFDAAVAGFDAPVAGFDVAVAGLVVSGEPAGGLTGACA